MKPLMEYAPFKIGERFEDQDGDVLEIVTGTECRWFGGTGVTWVASLTAGVFKPLDRKDTTAEVLEGLITPTPNPLRYFTMNALIEAVSKAIDAGDTQSARAIIDAMEDFGNA